MVPIHSRQRLEPAIQAADEALDHAWATGADVEAHLMTVKELSKEIGRDPAIEEAKVLLARANGCTPSEAFDMLRQISQHTNRKVRDVAHDIVDNGVDAGAGPPRSGRDKRRRAQP